MSTAGQINCRLFTNRVLEVIKRNTDDYHELILSVLYNIFLKEKK